MTVVQRGALGYADSYEKVRKKDHGFFLCGLSKFFYNKPNGKGSAIEPL